MEKPPSIENLESKRYRTIERKIIEVLKTGESIEEVTECNGKLHRKCVDKVSYDDNNEIAYVEQISRTELGACDLLHA